jgi:hypothetical protein
MVPSLFVTKRRGDVVTGSSLMSSACRGTGRGLPSAAVMVTVILSRIVCGAAATLRRSARTSLAATIEVQTIISFSGRRACHKLLCLEQVCWGRAWPAAF